MVGDGFLYFKGIQLIVHPFVIKGSTLIHSSCAVAGVRVNGTELCFLFLFLLTKTERIRAKNMMEPKITAGGKDRGSELVAKRKFNLKYELLLDEAEGLLIEELIEVRYLRNADDKERVDAFSKVLMLPVRLLVGKKNRTIRQEAILAYAKKKLRELGEERRENVELPTLNIQL